MKVLLFVLDGLGDLPCPQLGGRTPLEAARTPNLDRLAAGGVMGLLEPKGLGTTVPLEDASLMAFALLGYDVRKIRPKRGPVEAVGLGGKYEDGWLAARCNFARVQKGVIRDLRVLPSRRAVEKVRRMRLSVPFSFYRGPQHRGVAVFRREFGDRLSKVDPHKAGVRLRKCRPLDKKSAKAARVVNEFIEKSAQALAGEKANFILLRGFGSRLPRVKKFSEKHRLSAAGTATSPVDRGILKVCGIKPGKNAGLIIIHYKATDPPAHRGDAAEKTRAIEKFDKTLKNPPKDSIIIVTADHCTPCALRRHSAHAVPALVSVAQPAAIKVTPKESPASFWLASPPRAVRTARPAGQRKFCEKNCTDFRLAQHEFLNLVLKRA